MSLFPAITPYDHGLLGTGDGNHLYYEQCGNPDGAPALIVHGGPGSGCGSGHRRILDPARHRIVLFDQRGAGRSTPHVRDPAVGLATNTTAHQLTDMELLRETLGIDRWMLYGASWGSVLSLVYAIAHPDRVTRLVLTGVATGRRAETDLLTRGVAPLFPGAWERFAAGAGNDPGDLSAAYARLLADPDPAVRERAALDWCDWEDAMVPSTRYADAGFRYGFARTVTHYWSHGSFLAGDHVLEHAHRLRGVPGTIVQGEVDLNNLVGTPWLLHHAWPGSTLILVPEAGHDAGKPRLSDAIVAAANATDRRPG